VRRLFVLVLRRLQIARDCVRNGCSGRYYSPYFCIDGTGGKG
jgi:hypothetical protein